MPTSKIPPSTLEATPKPPIDTSAAKGPPYQMGRPTLAELKKRGIDIGPSLVIYPGRKSSTGAKSPTR